MTDSAARDRLQQNWNRVVEDVHQAASRAGRDSASVTIIGVTKYVDVEITSMLVDAGCLNLGENRPQLLWQKAETMSLGSALRDREIHWHLIGHLQRNKARRTLRHRPIIHSIDSARLLSTIAEESASGEFETSVMLEVNISGEEAKTGMSPEEIRSILSDVPARGVRVIGLMAMAGWGTDSDAARRQFAATREFRDTLSNEFGVELPELSMGMSGDFAEAIAEGATMVRIGSRLYEGVVDIG